MVLSRPSSPRPSPSGRLKARSLTRSSGLRALTRAFFTTPCLFGRSSPAALDCTASSASRTKGTIRAFTASMSYRQNISVALTTKQISRLTCSTSSALFKGLAPCVPFIFGCIREDSRFKLKLELLHCCGVRRPSRILLPVRSPRIFRSSPRPTCRLGRSGVGSTVVTAESGVVTANRNEQAADGEQISIYTTFYLAQ